MGLVSRDDLQYQWPRFNPHNFNNDDVINLYQNAAPQDIDDDGDSVTILYGYETTYGDVGEYHLHRITVDKGYLLDEDEVS